MDGTLIQAKASQKSFRSKNDSGDGDGTNFRGHKRTNQTHESSIDPDVRLYKKGYGRQSGYAIRLSRRWLIESGFRWLKQTGPLRQVKLRGLKKVDELLSSVAWRAT